jgi:hypothetical protein
MESIERKVYVVIIADQTSKRSAAINSDKPVLMSLFLVDTSAASFLGQNILCVELHIKLHAEEDDLCLSFYLVKCFLCLESEAAQRLKQLETQRAKPKVDPKLKPKKEPRPCSRSPDLLPTG